DFSRLAVVLGTWVWIIGIAVFLLVNVISLVRLRRRCIGAVEVEKRVYLADNLQTPFVLGLFRPRICLPSALTEAEQDYILRHERMHIRRGDHIWKLLAFLALALHWFNPVVWLGFRLFVRDMETACDERVLSTMDENARADYAALLLRVSVGYRLPAVSPAFGEDSPKARIKRILRYKKPLKIVTAAAFVVVIVLAALLIANPKAKTAPAAGVIPEFPLCEGEFYCIFVCRNGESSFGYGGTPEEYYTIYSSLQNLAVEVKPASESRSEDRDAPNTLALTTNPDSLSTVDFHFSSDFSRLWIDNGVKPSYTYVVEEPDSVRELFTLMLTGKTENTVLDTAIEANRVALDTEYITAIYCPPAQKDSAAIKVGTLHAQYVAEYLCAKTSWTETLAPGDTPASPESAEFVISDDLRVQIWRSPRLAVIRCGEEEIWFITNYNDYSDAVDLILNYSLRPTDNEESTSEDTAESSEAPTAEPTATPSPTAPASSAAPTPAPTPKATHHMNN
ncbi:MAG: hypothetical protein J6I98_06630, partial [Clostridia bacterium]|nr:hypothetical protein [Clostridia bacterium]